MNKETNYATNFYSENLTGIDLLEKNVADYPASSVARFLLLYHYKKTNNPLFEELAKQTGTYLNNPSWIQFQLNQISSEENKPQEIVDPVKHFDKQGEKEIFFDEKKEDLISNSESNSEEKELTATEILDEIPGSFDNENNKELVPANEELRVNEQTDGNISLKNQPEKELPFEEKKEELISKYENNVEEKELPANEILDQIPESFDSGNKNEDVPDNEDLPLVTNEEINGNISLENEPEKELPFEDKEEELLETKSEDKDFPSTENQEIIGNSASENSREEKSVLDIKIPEEEQNKSESETSESNTFPEEENEDTEISFEPLHTVDYFASQGIKITEEDLANDHLGKQVKSFTAWLKSMKKLHPGQLPDQNEVVEKIIQSASESSNQDAHVLTEAMADVLVKQNKKEKAIEMYQKLSLLNPSKSAYFAAKIESLKIV